MCNEWYRRDRWLIGTGIDDNSKCCKNECSNKYMYIYLHENAIFCTAATVCVCVCYSNYCCYQAVSRWYCRCFTRHFSLINISSRFGIKNNENIYSKVLNHVLPALHIVFLFFQWVSIERFVCVHVHVIGILSVVHVLGIAFFFFFF